MALQSLNLLKVSFLNRTSQRFFSLSSATTQTFRKWYRDLWTPQPTNTPPYEHFTQIGDPVLRLEAAPVPEELIDSKEVDLIVEKMVKVLRKYDCVGVAAPQIGISLRIIVMEFREEQFKKYSKEEIEARQMTPLPLAVFINPTLKVTNHTKHKHTEGCMSVRGYSAAVERFETVTVTGVGKLGTPSELHLSGWSARIAQHEMDHLNGTIYIDRMDRSTFTCTCWEAVNTKCGRVEIPFYK